MVRGPLVLACLALCACAALEGTVLIARDGELDAAQQEEPLDAGPEAGQDSGETGDNESATRGRCRVSGSRDGFYEDFSTPLSASRWLVASGPIELGGRRAPGGFARDNVGLDMGALVLRVRGDQYEGPVRAADGDGRPLASGKHSAAALVTRDLFASATYQVQGRFAGPAGVEVALWFVRDDDSEGAITISTPGLDGPTPSYAFVSMHTRDGSSSTGSEFALGASLDDRAAHILRFDWYTTADNAAAFWVDDMRRFSSTRSLPSRKAGRLWIVAWLREGAAAPFDTAEIRVENAFVTPFGNDGDECTDGELAGPFLVLP
jgi:hypothetical protein